VVNRDDAWWHRLIEDRRVIDGALVVVGLGLTVLAVHGRWSVLPAWVVGVAGALGSLAQWPRRQWPSVALVAGAAGTALSGNPLLVFAGLYAAAVYAPRRQVWAYPVVAWVGCLGYSWLDGAVDVVEAVGWALLVGLVTAVGAYVAARRSLVASLRDRAARAETERHLRDEQARAAERARIAREMHDVLAHKVSLIALHAGALELQAAADDRLRRSAALIRLTAREALQELRTVLGMLRTEEPGPPETSALDLTSLVRTCVEAGQPVQLRDAAGPMPPATARVVNRIVQEGLTNARKHAPGAATTVTVDRDDSGAVTVLVRNDLVQAVPMDLPGSGSGLVGLAERVRLVGGTVSGGPVGGPGERGWELRAVVPWLEPPPVEPPSGDVSNEVATP
jgi:Signal transduction histidine kinase